MRTALELIVRPFVVADVTSPKQPAANATAASTQSNSVIDYGSNSVTLWNGTFNQTVTFYFIHKPKEKRKQNGAASDPFAPDPADTAP